MSICTMLLRKKYKDRSLSVFVVCYVILLRDSRHWSKYEDLYGEKQLHSEGWKYERVEKNSFPRFIRNLILCWWGCESIYAHFL